MSYFTANIILFSVTAIIIIALLIINYKYFKYINNLVDKKLTGEKNEHELD